MSPEPETHTSHITRLWKAMGEPVGLSDAELIRRAAVRLRELATANAELAESVQEYVDAINEDENHLRRFDKLKAALAEIEGLKL